MPETQTARLPLAGAAKAANLQAAKASQARAEEQRQFYLRGEACF